MPFEKMFTETELKEQIKLAKIKVADFIFQELGKEAVKAKKEMQKVDDVQRRNPRLAEIEYECGERILNFWRNTSYHLKLKLQKIPCASKQDSTKDLKT